MTGGSFAGLAGALQLGRARPDLARRNMPIVDGRIIEIAHHGGHIATVNLDTGRNVTVDILFARPRLTPSASLHEALGLAAVDMPLGITLKVEEGRDPSMPGINAAGDLANPLVPSVTLASSHGAMAGIFAQQSMLVWGRRVEMSMAVEPDSAGVRFPPPFVYLSVRENGGRPGRPIPSHAADEQVIPADAASRRG
jgi:hypothetical protein